MSRRWPQVLVELIGLGTRKKDSLMETGSSWVVSCLLFLIWSGHYRLTTIKVALDLIESLHHRQRSTGYLVGACFSCFTSVVSLDHGKHYPLSGTSSKNQRFMMDFWWFLMFIMFPWDPRVVWFNIPYFYRRIEHTLRLTPWQHRLRRLDWVIVPDRGAKHLFRFQDRPLFVGWFSQCVFPIWFPSI